MKKLLERQFVLEGATDIKIFGYYNPNEDFNGWQCPYFTEIEFRYFCNRMGWRMTFSKNRDTVIIDNTDDYDEIEIKCVQTLRLGWMSLIHFDGWVWMLFVSDDDNLGDMRWQQIAIDKVIYNKTG